MPARLKPRPFKLGRCSKLCSLSEEATTPEFARLTLQWYCEGANNELIEEKARIVGFRLSLGAIARHRANHLIPLENDPSVVPAEDPDAPKLSDIEILERFIQKGAESLRLNTGRITPEMTMKAMELKYKLTQGNAFQGFLDAVNGAFSGEEQGDAESPDTVKSEDEQAQAAPA